MKAWWHILLYPLGWLYATIIYIRNMLYDAKILTSQTVDIPTICIGNVAVGGTGKTPQTEDILRMLQGRYKTAVLSRGYKRKSEGFQLADENATVYTIGDEMMQVHSKFAEVPVAVCKDRIEGIKLLREAYPDLQCVILDDAFQHRQLTCGFNIVLTTYDNLFPDDKMLPYGTLRDSRNQVHRADVIIVTKCPQNLTSIERRMIQNKLEIYPYQHIFFSYIDNQELDLSGTPLVVTGIAQPHYLLQQVQKKYPQAELLAFADHHFFDEKDIDLIAKNSEKFACIVTTEKDYVRLKATNIAEKINKPIFVTPIQVGFFEGHEELEKLVIQYINTALKRKKK